MLIEHARTCSSPIVCPPAWIVECISIIETHIGSNPARFRRKFCLPLADMWTGPMIHLTRINHASVVLNSDLIEHIDTTPDTVIALTTGQKIVVLESADEVIRRVIEFRRRVVRLAPMHDICSDGSGTAA